jgi:hypothetical protein
MCNSRPMIDCGVGVACGKQLAKGRRGGRLRAAERHAGKSRIRLHRQRLRGTWDCGVVLRRSARPPSKADRTCRGRGPIGVVPDQSRSVPDNVYAGINATIPPKPDGPGFLLHGGFEPGMADAKVDLQAALLGSKGRLRCRLNAVGSTKRYGPGGNTAGVVLALSCGF